MTDWFGRPVLHVKDVEASLRFYMNQLGFTSPWRYDEDGIAHVAQVDGKGCALILADTWPEKVGKGLMFISLNAEPETQVATLDALRTELEEPAGGVTCGEKEGVLWGLLLSSWSMIPTAINSSSTIQARPHPARLPQTKRSLLAGDPVARPKPAPIIYRPQTDEFVKGLAERARVLIPHLPRNLFHRECGEVQKLAGLLHLQVLHILGRRKPRRLLKSAQESSLSKPRLARHAVDRNTFRTNRKKPELHPQHCRVTVMK